MTNPDEVSKEEVQDIYTSQYGIDAGKLNASDRNKLANIISKNLSDSQNTSETVNAIKNGNMAQINISKMSVSDLKAFIRMTYKIKTFASTFAMEDALRVLQYLS